MRARGNRESETGLCLLRGSLRAAYRREYDPDLSLCAIRLAKERNANSAAYVLSILERWKAQGVTHIDQVKKQNQNAVTKKSAPSDYTDPALYQEEGDLDAVFGRYPKNKG